MLHVLAVLIGIPVTVYRGWILSLVWSWFFVPLGAPTIGVALAIGISIAINIFSPSYVPPKIADADDYGFTANLYAFMYSTAGLLWGFVVSFFV